ncbi:hypothetical protein QCD60_24260 [Pokkaliibacter sp. MBI-7]|uniref:hypothetical protein n=1 Tax=Pokkaliibacter sp. MBI-7 TaxID=3040600 RepID=UPI0024471B5D|nr:hypothetical protein [Pokkaliibacter sp. MBI-7]MDH2435644.1 hypothetical protein [Pokkaliibacter sp. MBI-7]
MSKHLIFLMASAAHGITATDEHGTPLQLAIIREDGTIVERGPHLAHEAYAAAELVTHNIWLCQGYMKVQRKANSECREWTNGNSAPLLLNAALQPLAKAVHRAA